MFAESVDDPVPPLATFITPVVILDASRLPVKLPVIVRLDVDMLEPKNVCTIMFDAFTSDAFTSDAFIVVEAMFNALTSFNAAVTRTFKLLVVMLDADKLQAVDEPRDMKPPFKDASVVTVMFAGNV